ncbi:MAG: formamidopyrimidine-DNA glycosylase [Verrucomicrobia bacterium]|nr:formamidopyrimidine-DNA glycosylase [Verrucomicrobiota bacterium]
MPELPDLTVYLEALERRVVGQVLEKARLENAFVLRTAVPPIDSLHGRRIVALRRLGKRIAFGFEGERWLVLHLMIAGRLQWIEVGTPLRGVLGSRAARGSNSGRLGEPSLPRNALAHFFFQSGTLTLTEAGTKRRASLHVLDGEAALRAHDRGGLEVLACTDEEFATALTRENHTLKRALTDPQLFSGIGNAYSDEILHAARLSPVALTQKLSAVEIARLQMAVQAVLRTWTERLRDEAAGRFPTKVTAFHAQMAVHGKFGKPCPVCGTTVQRIRHAENEVNYCPRCQTGGKLLADRSLSRLLKGDWPRTIEALEDAKRGSAG